MIRVALLIFLIAAGFRGNPYILSVFKAMMVIILSWVAGLIAIVMMGVVVTSFGRQMFWFSNPGPILGIYAAPALYVIIIVQRRLGMKMHKVRYQYFVITIVC